MMAWELTWLRPSDGIRWAVRDSTGRRSATWRFWGNKKGDFYLSVRTLGGVLKTSLHKDGRCFTGFVGAYASRKGVQQRHLEEWELPRDRLVQAVQVVFPEADLSAYVAADKEPMRWLPAPDEGSVRVATVFVLPTGRLSELGNSWPGAKSGAEPIGFIETPTRTAFVVHKANPLTDEDVAMLQRHRAQVARTAQRMGVAPGPSLRAILIGQPRQGHFLIDIGYNTASSEVPGEHHDPVIKLHDLRE